jgi:hypothetical protein
MSKTTTKYSINQFKQIIPLNENIVNFELNFDIQSENNLPFKAVVLSEDELNSENPINYQDVTNGVINGNIVNDKGVYQLYYLLLKADQPVDCNLTLDIKEIPINPEIVRMQQEQINNERENMLNIQRQQQFEIERKNKEIEQKRLQEIEQKRLQEIEQKRLQEIEQKRLKELELEQKEKQRQENGKRQLIKKVQEKEESKTNWLIIFAIFGVVAFGIWFLFFNNKKKKKTNLNLPDGNKLEIPKVKDIESILKIENPKVEIVSEIPKIEVPKIEVPKIEIPKLEEIVPELPKVEIIPDIEVSKLEIPKVEIPTTSRRNNNLLNRLNSYFDN